MFEYKLNIHKSLIEISKLTGYCIKTGTYFSPSYNIGYGSSIPLIMNNELCKVSFEPKFINPESVDFFMISGLQRCIIPVYGVYRIGPYKDAFYFFSDSLIFLVGFINDSKNLTIIINDFTNDDIRNCVPIALNKVEGDLWLNNDFNDLENKKYSNYTGLYPVSLLNLKNGYSGKSCIEPMHSISRIYKNLINYLKKKENKYVEPLKLKLKTL